MIFVTGGAGYIGPHTCVELLNAEHDVTVFDNFCNSQPEALARVQRITGKKPTLVKGDTCSGTSITASSIASAMRSTDDKRGSRLLLSISDRCCTDMPAKPETFSSVRRRWLR